MLLCVLWGDVQRPEVPSGLMCMTSPLLYTLSALHANGKMCHRLTAVCFRPRGRRDRKGRSDSADCQNWQDIDPQNSVNEIEAIETSAEDVDGRQKVRISGCCDRAAASAVFPKIARIIFTEVQKKFCKIKPECRRMKPNR